MRREQFGAGAHVRAARSAAILVGLVLFAGHSAQGQFLGTNFVTGDADGAVAATATSTAVGTGAIAGDTDSTAIGWGAEATGFASTALGQDATASGAASSALGEFSTASGISAQAIGAFANASGDNSNALGFGSFAGGNNSLALGYNATAIGVSSTAVGMDSTANHANATAIGFGATTTRANQMMFGTTTNTYTAAGITSAASTAAQSGPVQVVTTDSAGNLAAQDPASLGLAGIGDIQALQSDLNQTQMGVAMAMALSGVPNILPDGANYAVSANWGGFSGESAVAIGGAARLTDRLFLNGGGALGASGRPTGGGRAGLTFAW
jgi:hypothetical protein